MSEIVPDGWGNRQIGSEIEILSGFPFKSENFTNDPSHTGLIRIRDLVKQRTKTFYQGEYEQEYLVTKGDVLIGMDGDFHIVKWSSEDALLNQRVCKIVTENSDHFDLDYLFHDMQDELLRIHERTGSTTVKHLSVKDIRGIQKNFPPLPEQKKTASILTSVDEVIENTQKQIGKLQDLKKATMNELLTKGIGHKQFKDSELGRIPQSWEVLSFLQLNLDISDGNYSSKYPTASEFIEKGIPFLRANNIGALEVDAKDIRFISTKKHSELKKGHLKKNDILISTRGQIGKVCLVQDAFIDVNINAQIVRINGGTTMHRLFLFYILKANSSVKQFRDLQTGTALKQLPVGNLLKLTIPFMPYEEQKIIGTTIKVFDDTILKLSTKLHQTQSLKKSLMQDLLTGKVRVSI